jgi:hypothetical protein
MDRFISSSAKLRKGRGIHGVGRGVKENGRQETKFLPAGIVF